MRGRVMSLWSMAWLGSTPVGGPLVGWVGQEFGGRWSLVIGGVPTLLVGLLTYPVLARVDARRARADAEEADAEKPPGEEPPSEG
jgi:MFS family permease